MLYLIYKHLNYSLWNNNNRVKYVFHPQTIIKIVFIKVM